jgi:DUF438 domain-containing protein
MSEFTNKSKQRIENLSNYFIGLLKKENGTELLKKYDILNTQFLPEDVLIAIDYSFDFEEDIAEIKLATNKLFNILYKQFSEPQLVEPQENSLLFYLKQNNKKVKELLNDTKAQIKKLNTKGIDNKTNLIAFFNVLISFTSHYTLQETIIFSEIEKKWKHIKCLKILWSLHDDVRRNVKKTIEILNAEVFDLQEFNKVSSRVYFDIHSIAFREEQILFPIILKTFENQLLEQILQQFSEYELQFVKIPKYFIEEKPLVNENLQIKFSTGELSLEQIELVFSYLPVDITYVDENDKVRFYSNPKHRIFPRSKAIIGRSVQNCHPHESLETVNQIVNSFKIGEKDSASFWIHMGQKFVLIQYFAVRNSQNQYKGVLEVSQEISEIQKLTGDKRLLDW